MADSLVIGEQIELIGPGGSAIDPYGTPSTNPLCTGTVFRLLAPASAVGSPSWNLGAPQPTTDIVGSLLLDGERPFGYRASNRTITLPVIIKAPTFQALIAAREVLLKEVDQQTWSLRWTRDTAGPLAGNTVALPLLFDCFRAQPSVYEWGGFYHKIPYGIIDLTFSALPYGRSDVAQVIDFPAPLAGRSAPPSAISIDTFSSVTGTQWAASSASPNRTQSAFWDPSASPGNNPTGSVTAPPVSILNANPDFAGVLSTGWAGNNGSVAATGSPPAGFPPNLPTGDALLYTNGGSLAGTADESGSGGPVACVPAQSFVIAGWVYSSSTTVLFGAGFQTAAHSFTSQQLNTYTVTANKWTYLATVVTCPTGSAFVYHRFGTSTLSGTVYGMHCTVSGATGATYTSNGPLSSNVAAGYNFACAATGTTTTYIATTANTAPVGTGDQFQIFASGSPVQAQIFTVTAVSQPSGGNVTVTFTPAASGAPTSSDNIVQTAPAQLRGLTLWAGFGSTNYYPQWSRLGGRVVFGFTLTDTYGTTISFSSTIKALGSNNTSRPRWQRVRLTIPYNPAFDYQNVAGYQVSVTNRGTSDLRYTQLYLSTLQAVPTPVFDPVNPPMGAGAVYEMVGVQGSARAPMSVQAQQAGATSVTRQFTTPGVYGWVCPPGVSTVSGFVIGGGGPGGTVGGALSYCGGGGGGGSAANASIAVTAGNTYTVTVGYGGVTGSSPTNGTLSSFTGNSVTITGNPGTAAAYNGTTAGTGGAAGSGGFAGGAGGAGAASGGASAGAGGGSSAGSAANGNTGATAATGGAGGAAVTGGGAGGAGGTLAGSQGKNGITPGGGGGGGRPHVSGEPGGNGAPGLVQLIYSVPTPFQTLVLHRPPPAGSESLSPDLQVSSQDTPNGTVAYPLSALGGQGLNARPAGTYTVAVVAYSWNTVSASRTIQVNITQLEQPGGATYTATVGPVTVTPNTLPATASTNAQWGPIVIVGEVTLPLNELPQDNLDAYFTASITDSNTSDAFQDILFLDTQGSTVIIMSATAYASYWVDEPASDRDIGLIMGSVYDRDDAVSVLDRATVSGPPLSLLPDGTGNPYLLAYCAEGAPNVQVTHFPRWWLDRYQ